MAGRAEEWRKECSSMRGNWCRDFVAEWPSCQQPVLKALTGPHPFFNHQQTPEGTDITAYSLMSVSFPQSNADRQQ